MIPILIPILLLIFIAYYNIFVLKDKTTKELVEPLVMTALLFICIFCCGVWYARQDTKVSAWENLQKANKIYQETK